jgi:hypothetical protein
LRLAVAFLEGTRLPPAVAGEPGPFSAGARNRQSMTSDDPDVPVRCPECGTETRVPLSEIAGTIDRHNETRHGGEECAQVDPDLADELADLVAEDLGLLD